MKPYDYSQIPDEPFCKVSALPVKAYRRTFNFLDAIFSQTLTAPVILIQKPFLDYRLEAQADLSATFS